MSARNLQAAPENGKSAANGDVFHLRIGGACGWGRDEGGSEQQSETEENVELGDITHALCHSPPGKSESHDRVPPKSGAQAGRPPHCLEPPGRDDHYIRTQCWWGSLSRSWEISFRGPRRPVSNPTGRLPHLLRRELDLRLVRRTLNRQYKL